MRTHAQIIIDAGGATDFARKIAADPNTAQAWKRTSSIPAKYWRAVVDRELATLEELTDAIAVDPAEGQAA